VEAITKWGAVPWLIPLLQGDEATLQAIYSRLDGIFLPGGIDIDPSCYSQTRDTKCGPSDSARDWTELRLVQWATRDRKPILGVCRGMQMLNVACGGTLIQDVPSQVASTLRHNELDSKKDGQREWPSHLVGIKSGSRLHQILGTEEMLVNSIHHQAVRKLAPTLIANATAPDGLIEGLEAPGTHFLVGVQCHPEEMKAEATKELFRAFLNAAAGFTALPSS